MDGHHSGQFIMAVVVLSFFIVYYFSHHIYRFEIFFCGGNPWFFFLGGRWGVFEQLPRSLHFINFSISGVVGGEPKKYDLHH